MNARAKRLTLSLALAGAASLGGCKVYDASLLDQGDSGAPLGGGIGWWSGNEPPGCFSAKMPTEASRPPPGPGDPLPPIYLAFKTLRIGSLNLQGQLDSTAWRDIGFDLDGTCTGSQTCITDSPIVSCRPASAAVANDGNYCRDNTFGRLEYQAAVIPEIADKYRLNDDYFNCALCVGDYNFLIRISGYNGKPDDDRVRVDFYPSPGLERVLPWDCRNADWKAHPCFTPDLAWTVEDDILVDPAIPGPNLSDSKLFDADGYVKEGTLVLHPPEGTTFSFPGHKALAAAYPITLGRSVVTGKLGRAADGTWTLTDGVIGGRTRGQDIIRGFRLIGFCENDQNYSLMETFVNGNLDILANGTTDPNAPCDAMSVGIGFVATQAVAGAPTKVDPLVECAPLGDGGADAKTD